MINDFKPWATGAGANVISQADFLGLFTPGGPGLIGFTAGTALSQQLNKVWRQSAFLGAGIAQAVSDTLNIDVLDDGNLSTWEANFIAFIQAVVKASVYTLKTGDTSWRPTGEVMAGRVRMNALSIGSAASGASERANADTLPLYTIIWNNFGQAQCPVAGGRGASAAADFAANKTIQLPDMRGRGPFGVAGMGNSALNILNGALFIGGNATTPGSYGGEGVHTLITNEIPAHSHAGTVSAHSHTYRDNYYTENSPNGQPFTQTLVAATGNANYNGKRGPASSDNDNDWLFYIDSTTGQSTPTVSIQNTGGDGAHNNMPPFMLGTWYLQL